MARTYDNETNLESKSAMSVQAKGAFQMDVLERLDRVETLLYMIVKQNMQLVKQNVLLFKQGVRTMQEIDDLTAEVQATAGVEAAGVVAINGLADQIAALVANATDLASLKAAVAASVQTMRDNAAPLAAAIAAPGTPTPTPV